MGCTNSIPNSVANEIIEIQQAQPKPIIDLEKYEKVIIQQYNPNP